MVGTRAPAKPLAAANPRIKWPFARRVESIYAQDKAQYAQQAKRFDLPLRNAVKTGKKLPKIVYFLQFYFFFIFVLLLI